MDKSKLLSLVGIAVLIAAWFVLRALLPPSAQWLFAPWRGMTSDHGWWVWAVGGGLLVWLEVTYLLTLYGPWRSRKPDAAVGLGCVLMAAIALGIVIAVLLAAVAFKWWAVVNFICFMTMLMALLILPQYYWAKWQDWRKRRQRTP